MLPAVVVVVALVVVVVAASYFVLIFRFFIFFYFSLLLLSFLLLSSFVFRFSILVSLSLAASISLAYCLTASVCLSVRLPAFLFVWLFCVKSLLVRVMKQKHQSVQFRMHRSCTLTTTLNSSFFPRKFALSLLPLNLLPPAPFLSFGRSFPTLLLSSFQLRFEVMSHFILIKPCCQTVDTANGNKIHVTRSDNLTSDTQKI